MIVDTGPDFRAQVLQHDIRELEGVLYTHLHADHCHGFDDLRAFSFSRETPIPCYLLPHYIQELKERFSYAFRETGYRGAKPQVALHPIPEEAFQFGPYEIDPVQLPHGPFITSGFRIGNFAYATDFKHFTPEQIQRWRGKITAMVASGIHFGMHPAHSVIPETVELFEKLEVKQGVITHISHMVDHERDSLKLPAHIKLAFDGMSIDV